MIHWQSVLDPQNGPKKGALINGPHNSPQKKVFLWLCQFFQKKYLKFEFYILCCFDNFPWHVDKYFSGLSDHIYRGCSSMNSAYFGVPPVSENQYLKTPSPLRWRHTWTKLMMENATYYMKKIYDFEEKNNRLYCNFIALILLYLIIGKQNIRQYLTHILFT